MASDTLLTQQVQLLDVASLESVRRFAEDWAASGRPLHVLINNAGIFSFAGGRGFPLRRLAVKL